MIANAFSDGGLPFAHESNHGLVLLSAVPCQQVELLLLTCRRSGGLVIVGLLVKGLDGLCRYQGHEEEIGNVSSGGSLDTSCTAHIDFVLLATFVVVVPLVIASLVKLLYNEDFFGLSAETSSP